MRCTTILLVTLMVLIPVQSSTDGTTDVASGVLIGAVHPGSSVEWEHVLLSNVGPGTVDLSGWNLSDGEGTWSIPSNTTLTPGSGTWVSVNTTAFHVLWGRDPDVLASSSGRFCLADKGDDLVLLDPEGGTVDQLWYGGGTGHAPSGWTGGPVVTPSTMPWGRILERTSPTDTDSADDWSGWTEPRCGWLEEVPAKWSGEAEVATFTTPEGGWDALSWAISSAEEDILVALYDLTSRDLAALLAKRAMAGVRVTMLLEGQPVGASADDNAYREGLLAAIVDAGGEVVMTAPHSKGERNRPYRFHHEKCCVVDGRLVVVATENWGASSFPPTGGGGVFASRGWGAVMRSRGMASSLSRVIEHDLRTCTVHWEGEGTEAAVLPTIPSPSLKGPFFTKGDVSLLVGPEAWGPDLATLTDLIGGARSSVELELACLDIRWGEGTSPLVEALLGAAARGARVRLLLDPGYEGEGDVTVRELQFLAAQRGVVNLTAMVADGIPGISRLHAKGAIIDGHQAILGSLNWAWSSVARNRELLVVIDSREAAEVLTETFRSDWGASAKRSAGGIPLPLMANLLLDQVGSTRPASFDGPMEVDSGGSDASAFEEESIWIAIGRAAVVVVAGAVLWVIEARFGVKASVSAWLDHRWRRLRRRWARFIRRREGRAAPDARRTSGPENDREQECPQDPPPLEPEAARW